MQLFKDLDNLENHVLRINKSITMINALFENESLVLKLCNLKFNHPKRFFISKHFGR